MKYRIKKLPITYCCQDCGDKISKITALRGGGRCNPCATIFKYSDKNFREIHAKRMSQPDVRKKLSDSLIEYYSKPGSKTKTSEATKKAMSSPEVREKFKIANREARMRPEARKKRSLLSGGTGIPGEKKISCKQY